MQMPNVSTFYHVFSMFFTITCLLCFLFLRFFIIMFTFTFIYYLFITSIYSLHYSHNEANVVFLYILLPTKNKMN